MALVAQRATTTASIIGKEVRDSCPRICSLDAAQPMRYPWRRVRMSLERLRPTHATHYGFLSLSLSLACRLSLLPRSHRHDVGRSCLHAPGYRLRVRKQNWPPRGRIAPSLLDNFDHFNIPIFDSK